MVKKIEKMQVDIDVIVPIYNVEQFLTQCLDSLIQQTIPIHLILINDGSTDTSGIIAQQYQAQYPDMITYIEQENAGLSAARNMGMMHSNAPYISFMDSDDWVSLDYYEQLLARMNSTAADIVCSDITFAYENQQLKVKKASNLPNFAEQVLDSNDDAYHTYIMEIFPMAQNKLWRAELIRNQYDFLDGVQYEDLDFFYRVYPQTQKIAFTTKGQFYYRQRSNSIVKTANTKILQIMTVFDHIMEYYQEQGLWSQYQAEIEYMLIRNCLVASAKRLAYAKQFVFIFDNYKVLYNYVNQRVPRWRHNKYLRKISIKHLYLRSIFNGTLRLHAILLLIISNLFKK